MTSGNKKNTVQSIYNKLPFEEILNAIVQEMTFNEFEAVVFYMFVKRVGWFSHFKLKKFSKYFTCFERHQRLSRIIWSHLRQNTPVIFNNLI